MNERELQRMAVDALRQIGYTVLVSNNRRKTSNSKGMPDCIVYDERRRWIALDFKNPNGSRLSKEQEVYQKLGMIFYPTSIGEALDIVSNKKATV